MAPRKGRKNEWWWVKVENREMWDSYPNSKGRYYYKGNENGPLKFEWKYLKFWNTQDWVDLRAYLHERHKLGFNIYPTEQHGTLSFKKIFRVFQETTFDTVKIVILGQDPYYKKGQADGLAFSVQPRLYPIPRSLSNILREYEEDLGFKHPRTGDLSTWARNGILLLNTIWTVEEGNAGVHQRINRKYPWNTLTNEVVELLSNRKDKLVFILWGNHAKSYRHMIDEKKHLVISSVHPSPRNFTNTSKDQDHFKGSRPFSKACEYLDISKAIWKLP